MSFALYHLQQEVKIISFLGFRIVKVNSEVVEEEKLDENCWDMPTTEDFSLDVVIGLNNEK